MHIVIAIVHHFLYGVNLPVHSMYWPVSGCNVLCCRFLTSSKWYVRVTISTLNFAVGVDGNPQPCCFRYKDWGNSTYVTLYMWFTSVINPSSIVCVSIPIQGWHLSTETWSIRVGSLQQYDNDECVMINWMVESCMAIYLGMAMETGVQSVIRHGPLFRTVYDMWTSQTIQIA